MFGRLIVCLWGLLILGTNGLFAQLSNDSLYRQIITDIFSHAPGPYLRIEGISQEYFSEDTLIDTASTASLTILSAEVNYITLGEDQFIRKIEVPYQIEAPQLASFSLATQDTLNRRQLKKVLKHSSLPLRGDDPRKGIQILRPFIWIGLPLVLSLVLFGLRTQ